jgi:hypothetical protein
MWLILFLGEQMLEQGGHSRLEQQMLSLVSSSQTLQTQYLQLQSALQEANHRSRQRNEEVERLRRKSKITKRECLKGGVTGRLSFDKTLWSPK